MFLLIYITIILNLFLILSVYIALKYFTTFTNLLIKYI